ncbi:MAG TPA: M50 family metallopeptidase [Thermomicrobiales bacterium]|nr:M50 family metallopeptidase [Thermomicrobiales bacterium]
MQSTTITLGALTIPVGLVDALFARHKRRGIRSNELILVLVALLPFAIWLQTAPSLLGGLLLAISSIGLSLFVTALVHELGHLAAAWILGWKIISFGVSPVAVSRHGSRWRVSRTSPSMPLGWVAATPRDVSRWRRDAIIVRLAGPLIATGAGAYLLVLTMTVSMEPVTWSIVMMMAFVLLVFNIVQLIPFRWRGYMSDGRFVLAMLAGGTDVAYEASIAQLNRDVLAETRPRDWNPLAVQSVSHVADGTIYEAVGSLFAFWWMYDLGNWEQAEGHLSRALSCASPLPPDTMHALVAEAVFMAARRGQDLDACQLVLEQLRRGALDPHTAARTEIAILLATGDVDAARQRAQQALETLRQADPETRGFELAWVGDLLLESSAWDQSRTRYHQREEA